MRIPTYQQQTIEDAANHLRQHGINPVKTQFGWNVTLKRTIPLPGTGRDFHQAKVERFTDVGIVEMAVNKGFNAKEQKGGSDWDE